MSVTRIHPGAEPVENPAISFLEGIGTEGRFHNPYSSRAEYNRRLKEFLELQKELLSLLGHDINSNNLDEMVNQVRSIGIYPSQSSQIDQIVLDKIFPSDWRDNLTEYEIIDGNGFGHRARKSEFRWDKIEFIYRWQGGRYLCCSLLKDPYSEPELTTAAEKAIEIYETLEFSEHLYGIRYWGPNPMDTFLESFLNIIGRIAPRRIPDEEIPDKIKKAKVQGYFNTDLPGKTYVAVELPDETRLRLFNADRSQFPDIIEQGDYVWCKRDFNRDGELLSVGL